MKIKSKITGDVLEVISEGENTYNVNLGECNFDIAKEIVDILPEPEEMKGLKPEVWIDEDVDAEKAFDAIKSILK